MIFKFFAINIKLFQVFESRPVILNVKYASELNFGIVPDSTDFAGLVKYPYTGFPGPDVKASSTVYIKVIGDDDSVVKLLEILWVFTFIMYNQVQAEWFGCYPSDGCTYQFMSLFYTFSLPDGRAVIELRNKCDIDRDIR